MKDWQTWPRVANRAKGSKQGQGSCTAISSTRTLSAQLKTHIV